MIRFAALLVAAAVLAVSVPAAADGIPVEKHPPAVKKIKKKRRTVHRRTVIEKEIVVEKKAPAPVVVAPPPPPPAVWMPGHWTWNAPMNTHVWVPGMYVWPTPPEQEQSLALWRLGKWIGLGRED